MELRVKSSLENIFPELTKSGWEWVKKTFQEEAFQQNKGWVFWVAGKCPAPGVLGSVRASIALGPWMANSPRLSHMTWHVHPFQVSNGACGLMVWVW